LLLAPARRGRWVLLALGLVLGLGLGLELGLVLQQALVPALGHAHELGLVRVLLLGVGHALTQVLVALALVRRLAQVVQRQWLALSLEPSGWWCWMLLAHISAVSVRAVQRCCFQSLQFEQALGKCVQ
jgi:hypothetical protein